MPRPLRRFLVLGLDGATFDLLDRWFAEEELPFLRRLAERGLRAPLASVFPPKTIPAWYSFATGQDPGDLGIFGFTEPDGGPGRSKLVQTFRPAEALWDRLSRVGAKVGVLNFPLKSPYPINGFVVPGMLTDRPATYPEELRATLESALGEPFVPELPAYRDADRERWMQLATKGVEQRGRAAEILVRQHTPDFLFVLFRETDRIQHQHWTELQRSFREVPADLKRFWRSVDTACTRIEAAFRAIGTPAATLVISDHGHGAARSDFFTNRWLADEGYLRFRAGGVPLRRRGVTKLLVAADRVPGARRILHAVVDRLRSSPRAAQFSTAVTGESSFEAMAAKIDWERTVAFSYPVPEGIYLNFRYNSSLTAEQGRSIAREIRAKLEAFPSARIEVFSPRELYHGRKLENSPALFLRIDGMETEPRMDFGYSEPMLRRRPGYFYGTGVHRMNGILLAGGDGVPAARYEEPLSLLDVAPTILEGMGVAVPSTMVGRSFAPYLSPRAS